MKQSWIPPAESFTSRKLSRESSEPVDYHVTSTVFQTALIRERASRLFKLWNRLLARGPLSYLQDEIRAIV